MRYDRMSGLDSEQLDELVWRIKDQLEEPWHKGIGRPKDLSLREAVIVACGYTRQNITQEVWAEIFDTSQRSYSACKNGMKSYLRSSKSCPNCPTFIYFMTRHVYEAAFRQILIKS